MWAAVGPDTPSVTAGSDLAAALRRHPGHEVGRSTDNARAAGWGELLRARQRERVSLTELPPGERGPILRAFWYQVPAGRSFIARLFGLAPDASANDFEAAAPRCPAFRIDPPPETLG